MRWAALALALAGCDPIWSVSVAVKNPGNQPVPGAAVMLACKEPARSMTRLTDAAGEAVVGGAGDRLPAGCTLAVARPGYATQTKTLESMCGGVPIASCERVRTARVVLAPGR